MELTLIIIVVLRLLLGESPDYDERQTAAQGKAAKYALWTFLGYSFVWILYCIEDYDPQFDTQTVLLLGCCVVLLVYMTIVIVLDAYNPLNFKGFPWFLLFLGACAIAIGVFFGTIRNNSFSFIDWALIALGIVLFYAGTLTQIMRTVRRLKDSKPED